MKKVAVLAAALVAVGIMSASAQQKAPVKIRFVSLAWQTQAIAATKQVLADWNAKNPNIQVEYQQVSWDAIQDYLTTSFEAKNVPDVFHYESGPVMEFATRGYLTDLSKMVTTEMKGDIAPGAWKTVTDAKGAVWAVPFLWESLIILYNKDLFKQAKVNAPTAQRPWTWDDLQKASKALTRDKNGDGTIDQWGSAFGLRSPTNRILNLSLGFNGDYFYKSGDTWTVKVGDNEKKLLKVLLDMHHVDKSASIDGLTATSNDLFNGFFNGKYAMLPGIGVWARQTIVESGPKNFNWGVLPPLKGVSQEQGSATQTLSVPAASTHKAEAMAFINFFTNRVNIGKLAAGDWLFPTRQSTLRGSPFQSESNGWKTSTESAKFLTMAPYQQVNGVTEVRSRVLTPIFQQLLANRITLDEAAKRIEQEGNAILAKYK
jgi:multiple sugar transport system substrate-binding protein